MKPSFVATALLATCLSLSSLVAGNVPPALHTFEEAVEELQELSPRSDAGAGLDRALKEAPAARQALEKANAPADLVKRLDAGVEALKRCRKCSRADLRAAATDVSFLLADAFEVFQPSRPTDLARIDVLSVRIPLELERRRPEAATQRVAELKSAVDRLATRVPSSGKRDLENMIKETEKLESAIEKGENAAAVAAARAIGDLVDRLEKVFPE